MLHELSLEEQAAIAQAACRKSLDGWAIVGRDYRVQIANDQFYDICKINPSQIIGKTFQEITQIDFQNSDEIDANLVMTGKSDGYVTEKTCQFPQHSVKIVLLVTGVFIEGEFQFFLSRILEAPKKVILEKQSSGKYQQVLSTLSESIQSRSDKIWAGLGIAFVSAVVYWIDQIIKHFKQ